MSPLCPNCGDVLHAIIGTVRTACDNCLSEYVLTPYLTGYIKIENKKSDYCFKCWTWINPGTPVFYRKGYGHIKHIQCPTKKTTLDNFSGGIQ